MKVNFLDTVKGKTYLGSDDEWYSTSMVTKMLKHPEVNSNIKLRQFLRENGIADDYGIYPGFMNDGYFFDNHGTVQNGKKYIHVIKVSRKGIEYLKTLLNENLNLNQNNN